MRLSKKIKRDAVYGLVQSLFWFFNLIPRSTALFIGAMCGLSAWRLMARDRHRIFRHLTLVYGSQLSPEEKHKIGRSFFVNSGKNFADVVRFKKHYATEIKPLVEVEGLEHFDQAYKQGKGLVGITGHLGNFELLAVHIASLGYEIAVIGRELYDPRLDRLLVENRRSLGLTNIATTDSPRRYLTWLKAGKALGVLIDTDSWRVRNMFIPAFGRLARTPVGQSLVGLRAGAAFVPMACLRTAENKYRIVIKPPVETDPNLSSEQAVYDVTCRCTNALEEIIRSAPDQWIWLHNRWRSRPENNS